MKLKGIGAAEGIAVAKLWRMETVDLSVEHLTDRDPEKESVRFADAQHKATDELTALYEETLTKDADAAMIFDIHRMMLEDLDFCEGVSGLVASGCNAEWAVKQTGDMLHDMFEAIDDETMRARAADVQDVSGRLIRILKGLDDAPPMPKEPIVVVSDDLLPSQTVKLDKKYVVGCVTRNGSVTSHSAILSLSMGIACIVGMGDEFDKLPQRGTVAIDGLTGEVIVDPNADELALYEKKKADFEEQKVLLQHYKDKEAITKSGHHVHICANIGSVKDAEDAKKAGADGVGLFRSEFLYLDSPDFPSEEKQFQAYKKVLEIFSPNQVIVRTLDLGSDKQAPYFNIPHEENPAMGYRAIRICLDQPEIFRTQLRALLRASVYGNLHIMFPMITSITQVMKSKELLSNLKAELKAEGIPVSDDIKIGVMIETPAAVVMSDELAKLVDFFSIGTNDLTQYTLAADRMNAKVSNIFNSEDPAIRRMIEITARNAHAAGIWVGICGEAGANTTLTPFFMENKIDELSVAAASILKVRRAVCESEG